MADRVRSRFSRALTPLRWLNRAVRGIGPERAVLAWLAAARLFDLAQPFLAPWAAVFIVEATVYRSLRSAWQQVAAVEWVVPWQVLGMAVAVLTGLLIGHGRWFGASGPWIVLLITWETVTQSTLLVDRLIETVLGVVTGLAVNALVFPPVYGVRAQKATRQLAWGT